MEVPEADSSLFTHPFQACGSSTASALSGRHAGGINPRHGVLALRQFRVVLQGIHRVVGTVVTTATLDFLKESHSREAFQELQLLVGSSP